MHRFRTAANDLCRFQSRFQCRNTAYTNSNLIKRKRYNIADKTKLKLNYSFSTCPTSYCISLTNKKKQAVAIACRLEETSASPQRGDLLVLTTRRRHKELTSQRAFRVVGWPIHCTESCCSTPKLADDVADTDTLAE